MFVGSSHPGDPNGVQCIRYKGERLLDATRFIPGAHDWRYLRSRRVLAKLTTDDFDVVHIHNVVAGGCSLRALAGLTQRIPTAWTLHDEWAPTTGLSYDLSRFPKREDHRRFSMEAGFTRDLYYRSRADFIRRNMPQPDMIISPSEYLRTLAGQSGLFGDSEYRVVPYGIELLDEPAATQAEARQRLGLPLDQPVVLVMAMSLAVPYKGIRYGLDAITRVASQRTEAERPMLLLGGQDAASAERSLPTTLDTRAMYFQTQADLAAAYRAADVTVVPSLADNFPYVALESLACGTPLLATNVGGLAEIVGNDERGCRVAPADADALADRLSWLLDHAQERQQMGIAGTHWVRKHCSMNQYVSVHGDLYREVIDRRASG